MSSASWASWRAASPPEVFGEPDDGPDVRELRRSQHTSRKPLSCLCGKVMPPGTRYDQAIVLDDGKFEIYRICADRCLGEDWRND